MDDSQQPQSLGHAAKGAVVWGAAFTILRDVIQFLGMIVLVRLLNPLDYGRFAIAQSIYLLISVISAKSFIQHALQVRDPRAISWAMHLSASLFFNIAAFVVTVGVAASLLLSNDFAPAALPLAILSVSFLIDVPANFAATRLRVAHEWRRLGTLTTAGVLLGLASAIFIAAAGGGVWALTATVLLTGVPFALHFFIVDRWAPDRDWRWREYRDVFRFGLTRVGHGGLLAGRTAAEQAMLAARFDLPALGIFTRSVGLANVLAGRFGVEVSTVLYSVVTRAEAGSERFRRLSGLILQGIAWVTFPAAAFLMFAAEDVVAVLYGPKWLAVAPLLPVAAAQVAMAGIYHGTYVLLQANDRPGTCLALDVTAAVVAIVLIFWLIPIGPLSYLAGLVIFNGLMFLAAVAALRAADGITVGCVLQGLVPAAVSIAGAALAAIFISTEAGITESPIIRLIVQGATFGVVYAGILRIAFPSRFRALLEVTPMGARLTKAMRL